MPEEPLELLLELTILELELLVVLEEDDVDDDVDEDYEDEDDEDVVLPPPLDVPVEELLDVDLVVLLLLEEVLLLLLDDVLLLLLEEGFDELLLLLLGFESVGLVYQLVKLKEPGEVMKATTVTYMMPGLDWLTAADPKVKS